MAELQRTLGMWGATSIGIGSIIGTGIFVLIGVASGIAGPAVILSFVIAGFTAFLTGLSSAELSSFITEAGGSYIYTTKAFGKFWGFLIGWMKSFDYIVGASAVSIGFAAYFVYFVGIPSAQTTLILVAGVWPLILMVLNMKGIKEASGTNNLLVVLKISALVLFVIVGWLYLTTHPDVSHFHPFFPQGIAGVFSGASLIFFAFVGFNTITIMAEEVKDPEKNVPRAVLLAFAICTLLYISVAITAVGLVDWRTLGTSNAPLETGLKVATDNIFILEFISFAALVATTSVIITSILGGSRALFAMARQQVLPKFLATLSKNNIPVGTVVLSGISMSVIVVITRGDLNWLASIFNFGTLLTYLFINLSLLRLRQTMPEMKRSFTVPWYPVTPVLGVISCVILAWYLSQNAIIFGGAWIVIGILTYEYTRKRRGTR